MTDSINDLTDLLNEILDGSEFESRIHRMVCEQVGLDPDEATGENIYDYEKRYVEIHNEVMTSNIIKL